MLVQLLSILLKYVLTVIINTYKCLSENYLGDLPVAPSGSGQEPVQDQIGL